MRKLYIILVAGLMLLAGCIRDMVDQTISLEPKSDIKVPITLNVRIPVDGPSTKAMADDPQVQNMVIVVFGSSGYFNEWVPVRSTSEMASENYNAASNYKTYQLKFDLSQSDSRLRLHLIANCPAALYNNPPISGVSSQDLEDVVMSKIRSKLSDAGNDGYWAKILLPYGVQIEMEEEPNTHELKPVKVNGEYIPTEVTKAQIERYNQVGGIPMVRNFARIYLKNLTTSWTIQKFCLAYAPAEGPIAPILPAPITTNEWGERVVVQYAGENDETGTVYPIKRDSLTVAPFTVRELVKTDGTDDLWPALTSSTIYTESFFINYQNYPMTTGEGENYRKISDAPLNYGGYSPANLAIGTYPSNDAGMTPWTANTPLYIYERAKPASGQKATRIIVKAYKTSAGESTALYYPLDLVDGTGAHLAFLRNFTYTIDLTGIAEGSGYDTIKEAADATGANVALDERTADLNEVSNGASLIAVSYIDATYIKQGEYDVMFRYEQPLGTEQNNTVTLQVGYGTGLDFEANTTAGNGSAFSGTPTIEKNDGEVVLYVRSGDSYTEATAAQIADTSIEKWGKITYTTATVDRNGVSAVNTNGYYTKGFVQTIRVYGGNNTIFRDVLINLTPLKTMRVECLDKYIEEGKEKAETVRVYIPNDLTRSMFPMTYKIEFADYTLNPTPGSNMPVYSGQSIIPGATGNKFYFIRNLTRDEYNELPTAADGTKYFDCPFLTTEVSSATTVYVANEYFTTASDSFHNYSQRQFTDNGTLGGELGVGVSVDYTFYMDAAHSGGDVKWNGEHDDASDRIIPHFVTITMEGITPAIASISGGVITYVDEGLERVSGNVYKLTVPGNEAAPSATEGTLHLVIGSSATYSLTLSTSGNTPNPIVYKDYTVGGDVALNHIEDLHFEDAAGNTITRLLAVTGQEAYFEFTYGGELMPLVFELEGFVPDDTRISGPDSGQYTFTPSTTDATQRFKLIATGSDISVPVSITGIYVDSDAYADPVPSEYSLTRFRYDLAAGFTNAAGTTAVTRVLALSGRDVYFTINYDDAPVPVTFSLTGLTPASTQTGITASGDTYTYEPTTTASRQILHFVTTGTAECGLSNLVVSSEAYNQPSTTSLTLTRFLYTFPATGFYTTETGNNQMTRVTTNAGANVYYRFSYDSTDDLREDVTLTAVGLGSPTSSTGTITNNGNGTYTYHSTNGQAQQRITWKTLSATQTETSTVTVASASYSNAPVASVRRRTASTMTGEHYFQLNNQTAYNTVNNGDGFSDENGTSVTFTNSAGYRGGSQWQGYTYYGIRVGGTSNNANGRGTVTITAPANSDTIENARIKSIMIEYYNGNSTVTFNPASTSGNSPTNWSGLSETVTITMNGGNNNSRRTVSGIRVQYEYTGYSE